MAYPDERESIRSAQLCPPIHAWQPPAHHPSLTSTSRSAVPMRWRISISTLILSTLTLFPRAHAPPCSTGASRLPSLTSHSLPCGATTCAARLCFHWPYTDPVFQQHWDIHSGGCIALRTTLATCTRATALDRCKSPAVFSMERASARRACSIAIALLLLLLLLL